MTIDGETYDPFSAQTLRVGPPAHESFKERIKQRVREKYTIPAEEVRRLIEEEESGIIRSAEEKAAITRGGGGSGGDTTEAAPEVSAPLI